MSKRHTGFAGLFLLATLAPGAADADEQTGRSLYLQNCAACHQTEGQGLGHPIPPLAGSPILLGDETEVAGLILHGKAGMPAFHRRHSQLCARRLGQCRAADFTGAGHSRTR